MGLFLEYGHTSFNKKGEELCGDMVSAVKKGEYTTLVLADGMGSGVKANILATLTSKILSTMVSYDVPLYECVETIIETLPVCKVRGVAYSTFSVIHLNNEGKGYMFEFDSPECIFFRNGYPWELEREEIEVLGKKIYKSQLELEDQDVIIVMSDGVPHAGMGKLLNFGWQRDGIIEYLRDNIKAEMSARCIAAMVADASYGLYMGEPGDDTTCAAVKIRQEKTVNIMIGPPSKEADEEKYIEDFLGTEGIKIVCGGTTSKIVAAHMGKEVTAEMDYYDTHVPPIGHIDGIDLVTEGVLTLSKLIELADVYLDIKSDVPKNFLKKDGASRLAQFLFEEATDVNFFVGQAINEAHKGLPIDGALKFRLVERLSESLTQMGKRITQRYY